MAQATLVGVEIDEGAELLRHLEDRGMPVVAALWLFVPEAEEWRLVIASPIVGEVGPLAAYKKIQETLREVPAVTIPLERIVALGQHDRLVDALRTVRREPAMGTVRALRGVINGIEIPDSFIYDLTVLSATDAATINQRHTVASKAALEAAEASQAAALDTEESGTQHD